MVIVWGVAESNRKPTFKCGIPGFTRFPVWNGWNKLPAQTYSFVFCCCFYGEVAGIIQKYCTVNTFCPGRICSTLGVRNLDFRARAQRVGLLLCYRGPPDTPLSGGGEHTQEAWQSVQVVVVVFALIQEKNLLMISWHAFLSLIVCSSPTELDRRLGEFTSWKLVCFRRLAQSKFPSTLFNWQC